MKFKCKQDLYWVQQPGYTGTLRPSQGKNPKEKKILEFIKGKEYEVIPYPSGASQEYIFMIAIGESRKKYVVLTEELHWEATNFARESFDFSIIGEIFGFNYSFI